MRRRCYLAAFLAAGGLVSAAGAAARPSAGPNAWPGDQRALAFLWNDASRQNRIAGPAGKPGPTCRVRARGRARLYRFHDMDLAGGAFLAEGADARLLAACTAAGRLTIEAVVTPAGVTAKRDGSIVSFSGDASGPNFALLQRADRLLLRLRTAGGGSGGAEATLCKLNAGRPQHVIVTYADGQTACYLDGARASVSRGFRGDLSNWTPQHLLFGDEWNGGRDWAGRLEGIALYARSVGADEARRKGALYAHRLAERKPAERIVLTGKLTEKTPTPTVKSIRPYRQCLAVYTYRVEKVHEGQYDDRKILVAHWVIMDAKPLGWSRQAGRSYRLAVEPAADHPQLATERKMMVQQELDLEIYYDVETPALAGDKGRAGNKPRPAAKSSR